ncbi:hypothetical protein [Rickettsiales endosymbiont of Stachyamoeba lipophora]|uniref:hypothetical protein n=1 Tax=Rickettsiales endosymbiont of Stachyamoeba lipophora TaxID=2486578 RepID=UPI000F65528A|nr:hypothetical protein [Rickettsiales endosymbiont of Stachyamoeba lipophora]AZL15991.1 hypothetical protein EF513_05505 [Rickettsiales endosymbiont of Stachyamoeba lipophora]
MVTTNDEFINLKVNNAIKRLKTRYGRNLDINKEYYKIKDFLQDLGEELDDELAIDNNPGVTAQDLKDARQNLFFIFSDMMVTHWALAEVVVLVWLACNDYEAQKLYNPQVAEKTAIVNFIQHLRMVNREYNVNEQERNGGQPSLPVYVQGLTNQIVKSLENIHPDVGSLRIVTPEIMGNIINIRAQFEGLIIAKLDNRANREKYLSKNWYNEIVFNENFRHEFFTVIKAEYREQRLAAVQAILDDNYKYLAEDEMLLNEQINDFDYEQHFKDAVNQDQVEKKQEEQNARGIIKAQLAELIQAKLDNRANREKYLFKRMYYNNVDILQLHANHSDEFLTIIQEKYIAECLAVVQARLADNYKYLANNNELLNTQIQYFNYTQSFLAAVNQDQDEKEQEEQNAHNIIKSSLEELIRVKLGNRANREKYLYKNWYNKLTLNEDHSNEFCTAVITEYRKNHLETVKNKLAENYKYLVEDEILFSKQINTFDYEQHFKNAVNQDPVEKELEEQNAYNIIQAPLEKLIIAKLDNRANREKYLYKNLYNERIEFNANFNFKHEFFTVIKAEYIKQYLNMVQVELAYNYKYLADDDELLNTIIKNFNYTQAFLVAVNQDRTAKQQEELVAKQQEQNAHNIIKAPLEKLIIAKLDNRANREKYLYKNRDNRIAFNANFRHEILTEYRENCLEKVQAELADNYKYLVGDNAWLDAKIRDFNYTQSFLVAVNQDRTAKQQEELVAKQQEQNAHNIIKAPLEKLIIAKLDNRANREKYLYKNRDNRIEFNANHSNEFFTEILTEYRENCLEKVQVELADNYKYLVGDNAWLDAKIRNFNYTQSFLIAVNQDQVEKEQEKQNAHNIIKAPLEELIIAKLDNRANREKYLYKNWNNRIEFNANHSNEFFTEIFTEYRENCLEKVQAELADNYKYLVGDNAWLDAQIRDFNYTQSFLVAVNQDQVEKEQEKQNAHNLIKDQLAELIIAKLANRENLDNKAHREKYLSTNWYNSIILDDQFLIEIKTEYREKCLATVKDKLVDNYKYLAEDEQWLNSHIYSFDYSIFRNSMNEDKMKNLKSTLKVVGIVIGTVILGVMLGYATFLVGRKFALQLKNMKLSAESKVTADSINNKLSSISNNIKSVGTIGDETLVEPSKLFTTLASKAKGITKGL